MKKGWEHFSHAADIGVRGYGQTPQEAFEQGALAMMAVMCDLEKIKQEKEIVIECEDADIELLFADWLNRLIYFVAVENMLFSKFEVRLDGNKLWAKIWGEGVDIKRHQSTVEVKAASYTELKVKKEDDNWIAQCVVDV